MTHLSPFQFNTISQFHLHHENCMAFNGRRSNEFAFLAQTREMRKSVIFGVRFKRFPKAPDPYLENGVVFKSKMSPSGHPHGWNEHGSGQSLNLHAAVAGQVSEFGAANIR